MDYPADLNHSELRRHCDTVARLSSKFQANPLVAHENELHNAEDDLQHFLHQRFTHRKMQSPGAVKLSSANAPQPSKAFMDLANPSKTTATL